MKENLWDQGTYNADKNLLRVRFFRKSKIEFLNPKESENRFRVSLRNRSDLSYNDESKELKNPL